MDDLHMRLMEEKDLPQVLMIEKENFSVPWSAESFRDMIARPESVFIVAGAPSPQQSGEAGSDISGYAGAVCAGTEGDVTNIAVLGRYKRSGIGTLLLDALIKKVREAGVNELFLEVREHNYPAIGLYLGAGFTPVGRRKNYYIDPKEDALIMKKDMQGGNHVQQQF